MIEKVKSLYLVTPRAEEYLSHHNQFLMVVFEKYQEFKVILCGSPPPEKPLPGINLPAQIIPHKRVVGNMYEMLRVILGQDTDDKLELDVLDIPTIHEPKYMHPKTIFLVSVSA